MNMRKTILLTAVCGVALAFGSCQKKEGKGKDPSTPAAAGGATSHAPTPNAGAPGGFVIQRASWGSVQEPIPELVPEPDITRMGRAAGQRLLNQRKAAKRLKNMEIFIRR